MSSSTVGSTLTSVMALPVLTKKTNPRQPPIASPTRVAPSDRADNAPATGPAVPTYATYVTMSHSSYWHIMSCDIGPEAAQVSSGVKVHLGVSSGGNERLAHLNAVLFWPTLVGGNGAGRACVARRWKSGGCCAESVGSDRADDPDICRAAGQHMSGSSFRNIGPTAIFRVRGRRSDICLEGRIGRIERGGWRGRAGRGPKYFRGTRWVGSADSSGNRSQAVRPGERLACAGDRGDGKLQRQSRQRGRLWGAMGQREPVGSTSGRNPPPPKDSCRIHAPDGACLLVGIEAGSDPPSRGPWRQER